MARWENVQMDIRKLALTAYGKVGTDWVRMTAAIVDGNVVMVRADGTNSIVPVLPDTYRTSGDIANVAAQLGHNVNFSAVPSVGLKNHTWKTELTLDEAAAKFGVDAAFVQQLRNSYADSIEAAA